MSITLLNGGNAMEKVINRFPLLLIKVQEKEEYLRDFINGKLYMNSSGFFRNKENNYRSDIHDGRYAIPTGDVHIVLEDPHSGKRIFLDEEHGMKPDTLSYGFEGDDRIPVFCMTLIDSDALVSVGDDEYKIKESIVEELSKFGSHCVIVPFLDVRQRIIEYNDNHEDEALWFRKVEYYEPISNAWKLTELMQIYKNDPMGNYRALFNKRIDYANQHEWRLILVGNDFMIPKGDNHRIVQIRKFEKTKILPISVLKDAVFKTITVYE